MWGQELTAGLTEEVQFLKQLISSHIAQLRVEPRQSENSEVNQLVRKLDKLSGSLEQKWNSVAKEFRKISS